MLDTVKLQENHDKAIFRDIFLAKIGWEGDIRAMVAPAAPTDACYVRGLQLFYMAPPSREFVRSETREYITGGYSP